MTWIAACLLAVAGVGETLTAGPVETVLTDLQFSEGPLWVPGTGLLFSDIPANTIYSETRTVFRSPSQQSNGLALDPEGRLVACEGGARRVTRTEKDGTIAVLADHYLNKRFNSPNDVVVRGDGTVFFTDPPYGVQKELRELPFSGVYSIGSDGTLTLLSVYMDFPNGIALSPDEKTLYVADSGSEGMIQAFDIDAKGLLRATRLVNKTPADGIKVDERGNIWAAMDDGIRVFSPEGAVLETIAFPEEPANCAFGGTDGKTLYVTARHGLYKVRCAVRGTLGSFASRK